MSGSGKGGSSVSTVQIPPEVLARYNAVNARAETVAQQPYQAYSNDPNAFVAPLTATQQAGIQNTNAMAGAAQPYYGAATEQLMQAQQGAQPAMGYAYQNLGQAQDTGQQYANQAKQYYGQAQGAAQPYYGAATQGTQNALQAGQAFTPGAAAGALAGGQAVNAGQLQTDQYMSPYTKNVVEATQNALQQQFGQQNAEQQAQAIKAGAFGGDRAGLQRAVLKGQQALTQSQAISPLYQQAYNQALQAAQQQQGVGLGAAQANRAAQAQMGQQLAALGQQAYGQQLGAAQQMQGIGKDIYGQNLQTGQALQGLGQQQFGQGTGIAQQLAALAQQGYGMGAGTSQALAGLGSGAQAAGLAGAQAQMAAGATEQQTQQAGLQAMYNQFMQKQGYPFQIAQFLANIAEGTGALSGNTTSTSMASDRRLKENVQKVGETNDGQPIYRYNFKGDPRTQIGLMAQEVEKDHPEAVDENRGYKSVDYKKATEDAIHKDDGGEVSGLERYSMAAPSDMLQKSGGLGALRLPQMVTGSNIPIKPGASAAEIASMRAPTATGLSPGSLEGAQAQYASLSGTSPQSGEDYKAFEMKRLSDFLKQHGAEIPSPASSQGGLVGAEGGAFARGGYANDGYVNPALQFYGPQGAKGGFDSSGPYGATLSPAQARQLLQGTKPPEDRRPSGIQQAKDIGGLGVMATGAWKERPDFMRSSEDLASRAQAAKIAEAKDYLTMKQAKDAGFELASGGMVDNRNHYANMGYVDPSSGPYGAGDDNSLGSILTKPQQHYELLRPNERRQMPQQSGLGQAMEIAKLGKTGYDLAKTGKDAADWVGSKLGTDAAGEAASKGVIDLTTKVPGLGAAAPEAVTAAAAAPEALAGAGEAAAAEGLGAAATEGLGGAALGASAALPVVAPMILAGKLFGLFNEGGAVPRRHFDGSDGSFVTPSRADRLAGVDTGEQMSDEDKALLKKMAMETTVLPATPRSGIAAPKAAETLVEIPAKPVSRPMAGDVGAGRAPFKHFASDLIPDSIKPDTKSALTSENLWVPLLSGIAAAGASRAPTKGQALSEGLLGATTAYTGLQKQQSATDKAAAETRGIDVATYQKSLQQTPAGNIVWLANGQIMLLGDYDKLAKSGKAPPLLGRIPDNADSLVSKWLSENKPEDNVGSGSATSTSIKSPASEKINAKSEAQAAPEVEPQKKVQSSYDETSRKRADEERNVALNGGAAADTAKDLSKRYVAAVAPMANAARDSQRYLGELAENLANATKGKGLDAPGFGYSGRAQFTNALNTMSRAFGGKGDFGQADTINQINDKIEALQSSISAAGGGQESYAALNMLKKAMANPNMSPRAYSQLAGDLMTTNQRAIDRDVHMSKYRNDSQGMLANAAQDFDRTHSPDLYNKESEEIKKMILTHPDLIKDFRSGKYSAKQIDDAFEKRGLRNMSRYFVGS